MNKILLIATFLLCLQSARAQTKGLVIHANTKLAASFAVGVFKVVEGR